MKSIFHVHVRLWPLVFIIFFLFGCASSTNLRIRRAPEIDLSEVRYIRVEPFALTGSLDLKQYHEESFIITIIIDILSDKYDKIARKNSELSFLHQRELSNELSRDGYYMVTLGREFDASLGGTISYTIKDDFDQEKRTDLNGKDYMTNLIKRTIECDVELTVTDKNRDIIGSSRFYLERTVDTENRDRYYLFQDLIEWEELLQETIRETYLPIIQKVAPYYALEKRVFVKGESKLFKEANKAAKNGDWERAFELWERAEQSGNSLDKGASLYNQAIFAEVEDRLDDALNLYQKAYDIARNSKWHRAISRTKSRIEEKERLEASDRFRESN